MSAWPSIDWNPVRMSTPVLMDATHDRGDLGPHFGIYRLNQGFDIPVAVRVGLKLAGIVRMARHVIGTNRIGKLRVPQNAHHLREVHLAFVREDFLRSREPAADIAHVDLVNLPLVAQVLNDRQDLRQTDSSAFGRRAQAQLESVVRAVDNRFVLLESIEDRRRIPVLGALIAERQTRRIVRMGGHAHIVLLAHGNDVLQKVCDALPVVVLTRRRPLPHGQVFPVGLELERFVGGSRPVLALANCGGSESPSSDA